MTKIPQEVLDQGYKRQVHVIGWHRGAVFFYEGTVNGVHHLRTPVGRQARQTTKDLAYILKHEPKV